MSSDKRKSPRFPIEQFIDVSFGRETFVKATGLDISASGMRCELEGPLDPYASIYILLKISEEETIEVNGIIVRVEKKGASKYIVGIEFSDDMYDEDKTKLKKYIKNLK